MEKKELANIIYDTLMGNEQLNVSACTYSTIDSSRTPPVITLAYYDENEQMATVYDVVIKDSHLTICRWCDTPFNPAESEYKHLCSVVCHNEEQAFQ